MSLFIFFIEYILFIFNIIISLFNDIYNIFILIILNNDNIDISDNSKNTSGNANSDNINNKYIDIKQEDLILNKYHSYFLKYNIYEIIDSYMQKLVYYDNTFIQKRNNNNKDLYIFVEYFIYILNNNYILFNNDIIEIFDQLMDNNKLYYHDELILDISSKKNFLIDYLKKFETFIHKWDKHNNILSCDKNNRNIIHDACLLNDIHFIKGVILTKPEYTKKDIFGFKPVQYLSSGVRNDLIVDY